MAIQSPIHGESLADILERVLNQGIVIAGDISISLVGIELVTIRLRLLIASVDKAKELGINWWSQDPTLCGRIDGAAAEAETARLVRDNDALRQRLAHLEDRLAALEA